MDKDLYFELDIPKYEAFLRNRITELRIKKNLSEHALSLQLGKSGSYIRTITNKRALPSVRELFNIIIFFEMTPAEFFEGFGNYNDEKFTASLRAQLCEEIKKLSKQDLEKLSLFLSWIKK